MVGTQFLRKFVFLFFLTAVRGEASSLLEPYRTDACTVPFGIEAETWKNCCSSHDFSYWVGGSLEDKQRADAKLVGCLRSKGITAKIAARVFELIPQKFSESHWGNRWHPRRANTPLNKEELAQVQKYKDSFNLKFPIVKDPSGHECSKKILQKMAQTRPDQIKSNLICFDLAGQNGMSASQEQLIYSDQCVGYFLAQGNSSQSASGSILGFGNCAKFSNQAVKTSAVSQKIRPSSRCKLSNPPMRDYLDMLLLMKVQKI